MNENKIETLIVNASQSPSRKLKKQKGASMIEYALVVAAIVGIGAIVFNGSDGTLDTAIKTKMTNVSNEISGAGTGSGSGTGG